MFSFRSVMGGVVVVFGLWSAVSLSAQVPDPVAANSAPVPGSGHSYLGSPAETVNPADGSLTLDIPIQLPKGRQLSLPFGIHYSSQDGSFISRLPGGGGYQLFWQNYSTLGDGWGNDLPTLSFQASVYNEASKPCPNQSYPITCWELIQMDVGTDYVFRGLDGVMHPLQLGIQGYDYNTYNDGYGDFQSTPDNYMNISNAEGVLESYCLSSSCGYSPANYLNGGPPVTVTDASGTVYQFPYMNVGAVTQFGNDEFWQNPVSITDRNGNIITLNSGGNGYTDTLGRNVVSWNKSGNQTTISVSGLGGNIVEDWTSVNESFPESYQNEPYNGETMGTCQVQATQQSNNVVSEMDLPNGQKWLFQYDPTYGRVSKIIYPDGAYVRYVWGLNPLAYSLYFAGTQVPVYSNGEVTGTTTTNPCELEVDAPVITDRYVSYDGTNEVLHQHFSYSTAWGSNGDWNSKQTVVTTTDLVTNQTTTTTYNYAPVSGTTVPWNQLASSEQIPVESSESVQQGSTTLRTVNETWANPRELTSRQTVYDNGAATEIIRCFDGNEQVTQTDEYGATGGAAPLPSCPSGSGDGSPLAPAGRLLHQTITTYSSTLQSRNIDIRPQSVEVDGLNNQNQWIAPAQYTLDCYDQNSLAPVSPVDFSDPGTSVRGNLTQVLHWVNPPGGNNALPACGQSPGSNALISNYGYDDAGQLLSYADPLDGSLGKTTETVSYADNYSGGGAPGPTDAFPTLITDALGHTASYSWLYASGTMNSRTGPNGNTTSYAYSDPFDRLTQISYPDGGQTNFSYSDTPGDLYIETQRKMDNSGDWTNAFEYFDGLGNAITACSNNGAGAWSRMDTQYSGFGEISFKSYPYTAGNCTGTNTEPGDSFVYDALGRILTLTHSDGSVVTTSYSGRATEVSDEGNYTYHVTRISQMNGLGELTGVCEVDSQSLIGSGGAPSACGLDIAATGFLTSYGYDPLGNLAEVQQNGLNNRIFTYDSLGRLLTADNPETGTISYAYDNAACGAPAAPGALTCRTDAGTVSTAYFYDPDHRLTEKAYSDGITPALYLNYDQSSAFGLPIVNGLGKETSAVSGATAEAFSYDSMSRLGEHIECYSYNCAALDTALVVHYGYHSRPN